MTGTKIKTKTDVRARDNRPKRRYKKKLPKFQVPIKFWFSTGVAISIFAFVVQHALPDSRTIDSNTGSMMSAPGVYGGRPQPIFDFYTILPESEVVVSGTESRPTTVTVIPEPDPIVTPVVIVTPEPDPIATPVVAAPDVVPAFMEMAPKPVSTPVVSTPVQVSSPIHEATPTVAKPSLPVVITPPAVGKMHYLLQVGSFRNLDDANKFRSSLLLQGFSARIESVTVRADEEWHRVQLGPFGAEDEVRTVRTALNDQGIDSMLVRKKL